MKMSTTAPRLPLDPRHVMLQFSRRGELGEGRFLYDEIAARMDERLRYIRVTPNALMDAGSGAGHALPLLQARYPQASYTGVDHSAPVLALARARHAPGSFRTWLDTLRRRDTAPRFVQADMAATGLPPESLELVWSNLALHWHPQPDAVLAEWRRVLKIGGLAMFSWLGPGTFLELRQALADAGLKTATPAFVDMHDFGDQLVENGFADPVMDQETLTLTYETPERLLQDVRALGGNPAIGRRAGLPGRQWLQDLKDALAAQRGADGRIALSVEVSYGHAWRAAARQVGGETRLSVSAIGRKQG
ncbi:methyltransferase domain-containing protein [Kerstersia gyiorum]|jgi:malonyl-CoA O-methyltransferase|uniref:methyltransferase domain-containing protein n=1 Tax=Kerstersia gyiorum TaxID=206506 RepID=UPI00242F474F|nr:methyltransferase domain-containing protein [Kerstersia gyiorum]MCH4270158.1 methyltransferase domain-containing protein [Kerstersia gyiorum]MCI1230324.1 methyltransferase domain-containing protein [Kerstersia gyiorum]